MVSRATINKVRLQWKLRNAIKEKQRMAAHRFIIVHEDRTVQYTDDRELAQRAAHVGWTVYDTDAKKGMDEWSNLLDDQRMTELKLEDVQS